MRPAIFLGTTAASLALSLISFASVPTGWARTTVVDGGTSALGSSIATTDTVAAVGAPFAAATSGGAPTGVVYVYSSAGAGSAWTAETVTAASPIDGGNFGTSVAVSGNLLAVGAPGTPPMAYVFAVDGGAYESVATLPDPASDKNGSFGGSVAVYAGEGAASYVAVAAPPESANTPGAVYVSRQTAGSGWSTPPVAITAPGTDSFGIAVAFAGGGQLLVGDPQTGAGQVLVYSPLPDGGWSSEGALSFSLDGGTVQQFGNGIATYDNLAVVTAPGSTDTAASYNGAAFVFQATDAGVWEQEAVLTGAAAESFANFVPAAGAGFLAVGSAVNTARGGTGQVDVWAQSGGGWALVPSSALVGDSYYGQAVGVVGSALFIGDTSALGAGAISDVTSSLAIETATYADGGAAGGGSDAAAGGGSDGAVSGEGDGAAGGAGAAGGGAAASGCGCTAAGGAGPGGGVGILAGWGLLGLAWGRRRRAPA